MRLIVAAVLALIALPAAADVPLPPVLAGTQLVAHTAYTADVDLERLVPRWVAYELTGPHSLGCAVRANNFHADALLPADHRAVPADYARSGFDIGHQAPAQDMAWSPETESDSFSLANMAPQLPHLNRDGWEGLEQAVRDWAVERGDLIVYVGPIFGPQDAVIGSHHVDVPVAFFKVVHDVGSGETLAFIMPQQAIPKGDLAPWEVALGAVEAEIGFMLPVTADRAALPPIWPADDAEWHRAHKAACGG